MECRHCAVCAPARLIELGIADFEFLHFLFGIGVGFCNAYAGDTAFDGGVYHGIALAAVGKRFAHLAAQAEYQPMLTELAHILGGEKPMDGAVLLKGLLAVLELEY